MMGKWTRLAWLLLHILFSAVPPVKPSACPTCTSGVGPEACKDGQFWSQKNKVGVCNDCTATCHDNRNMIEVNPCTKLSDRKCQCKAGYSCPSPVRQTCRRACEPCEGGFTNTLNLNISCKKYTHCAGLGMVVIKEGSRTSDRVCGNLVFPQNLKLTVTTRDALKFSLSESTEKSPSEGSPSEGSPSEGSPSEGSPSEKSPSEGSPSEKSPSEGSPSEGSPSEGSPSEKSPSEGSPSEGSPSEKSPSEGSPSEKSPSEGSPSEGSPSSESAEVARIPEENEGPVPPSQTLLKTTWICLPLLLLIFLLFLISCLTLKCKGKAIKNRLEWAGLVSGRSQPRVPTASPMEASGAGNDVTDSVREFQGQGSFPGKNQQVTMEHVGKADGVNNTVGSIFIYSPGMVILGSNSNEKKEEASGEDGNVGEDTRLMSIPQQESSSEEDFRFATQEELDKELSIPIPATSK